VDAIVERHGAVAVAPEAAHTVGCDIFSPCALGAVLNPVTIPELRCDAVVGSANNQLAAPADAERLRHRGIVYAPDYIANAGGVINIAEEPHGYDRARAYDRIRSIHDTLLAVFDRAEADGTTTGRPPGRGADRRREPHPPDPHLPVTGGSRRRNPSPAGWGRPGR
jgi:leucine dehydrogenase